jgi:hypothetical protein
VNFCHCDCGCQCNMRADSDVSEEEDDAFQEDWIWLVTEKDVVRIHL